MYLGNAWCFLALSAPNYENSVFRMAMEVLFSYRIFLGRLFGPWHYNEMALYMREDSGWGQDGNGCILDKREGLSDTHPNNAAQTVMYNLSLWALPAKKLLEKPIFECFVAIFEAIFHVAQVSLELTI